MIEPLVVLEPVVRDQAFVLANLFELYVHDFSEQVPLDLQPNGRFDLPIDESWWQNVDHFPFFIRVGGKLCGFALVRRGSRVTAEADVMDLAEFFVVRGARTKGVGTGAAHALFAAFPGRWEIRVRQSNVAAGKFWRKVAERLAVGAATVAAFSAKGVEWEVLRLDSMPVPTDSQ
jgi:predicted acetyltransferase